MAKKQKRYSKETVNETDKTKALELTLKNIEKDFGKGAVMKLGDKAALDIDVISTSSISIDRALGVGGLPRGRIIEMFGPESSGKTTLALHCVAECQKGGGIAAYIDAEHALDPVYAKALGVNIDDLIISQPDTGEQALEIAEALIRSGAIDILVVDSVAALVTKAEIEGEMGDSHIALQARLMSQALKKLAGIVNRSNATMIFINQLRTNVGISYGNPEVTPGGRALKFYATMRIEIRRGEPIKTGKDIHGYRTRIKVVKNKVAPPFKTAEVDLLFGEGISKEGDLVDMAADFDIIKKAGAWYSYNGEKIGQGRDKAKMFLKENPELADHIREQIMERLNGTEEEK